MSIKTTLKDFTALVEQLRAAGRLTPESWYQAGLVIYALKAADGARRDLESEIATKELAKFHAMLSGTV